MANQNRGINIGVVVATGIITIVTGIVIGLLIGLQITDPNMASVIAAFVSLIGLLVGISSLVLAGVAIWISFHFRSEADAVNRATQELLGEVRSDAKAISGVVMSEFKETGASFRQSFEQTQQRMTSMATQRLEATEKLTSVVAEMIERQRQAEAKLQQEVSEDKDNP